MTAEQFARARDIFLAALEHPEAERARFVAERCQGDAALQREVEELLASHLPTIPKHAADPTLPKEAPVPMQGGTVHFGATPDVDQQSKTRAVPSANARNLPSGTVIAQRYRIVTRLGAGGMGEVFHADDLVLEQAVALKFLPRGFAKSTAWIARLRQEARLARTITHPNICRVHDLVEWNGEFFLTMEYIDGEDMSGLYRRIGRLPVERALDVARQICMGLAVAHQNHVLHRDLKPPNIMINGVGQVRITDFGVAALAHEIPDTDIRTGTAAYMAPEQITGRSVSVQSDIYSLGLVLFELFTGQQAFSAETIDEYTKLHENTSPPTPSQFVHDIPPEVERIILQCLEKDPAARPASALVVAAALPGSNVLRDVLAAQLTPPPEIVALARVAGPRVPSAVMLLLIGILLAGTWAIRTTSTTGWDQLGSLPPGSLKERARATLRLLNDDKPRPYSASGYCDRQQAGGLVEKYAPSNTYSLSNCESAADPVYWYRESPNALAAVGAENLLLGAGRVTIGDPPISPGSRTVILELDGTLNSMIALPQWQDTLTSQETTNAQFDNLLKAAQVDAPAHAQTPTISESGAALAMTHAWGTSTGDHQNQSVKAIGVELANQPVLFTTVPTATSGTTEPTEFSVQARREVVAGGLRSMFLIVIAVALPWAWRGYWSGRIDRDGAIRLALFVFALDFSRSLLGIGHADSLSNEVLRLSMAFPRSMGLAAAVSILFVVVDLNARRYWPEILVTWNRAIRSQFSDVNVRRHVLTGVFVGCLWVSLSSFERALVLKMGWTARPLLFGDRMAEKLYGLRDMLASYLSNIPQAIVDGLMFLLLLVLMRMLTRHAKLAILLTGLLLIPVILPRGAHIITSWIFLGVGGIGTFLLLITRVGLLAVVAAFFSAFVLSTTPLANSLNAWYADLSLLGVMLVLALAVYGALPARTRSI